MLGTLNKRKTECRAVIVRFCLRRWGSSAARHIERVMRGKGSSRGARDGHVAAEFLLPSGPLARTVHCSIAVLNHQVSQSCHRNSSFHRDESQGFSPSCPVQHRFRRLREAFSHQPTGTFPPLPIPRPSTAMCRFIREWTRYQRWCANCTAHCRNASVPTPAFICGLFEQASSLHPNLCMQPLYHAVIVGAWDFSTDIGFPGAATTRDGDGTSLARVRTVS